MSQFRNVASHTAFLSIAQILNPVTSILLVSMIARSLGPEALGGYSLVLTIFYMATGLAGLGLATPITRTLAIEPNKASDYLVGTVLVAIVTGTVAIVAVRVLVDLFDYPAQVVDASNLLMWGVIPSVALLFLEAIFMAFNKARFIAIVSVVENLCKVVVGVTLLALGYDILSIFVLIVALRIFALLTFLGAAPGFVERLKFRTQPYVFSELKKSSPIFTSNLLLESLFGRLDILLLSKLATITDVGYYSAALRFVDIARIIPRSFKRVALPPMAETYASDLAGCIAIFRRGAIYLSAFGIAATLALFLLAGPLIQLLYGDGFEPAEGLLRILAFILIPASLCNLLGTALFASHNERLDLISNLIRVVCMAVFCTGLFFIWGAQGVALGLVAAHLILLCLQWALTNRFCFSTKLLGHLARPALAAGLVLLITRVVPAQYDLVTAIGGLGVYCGLLLLIEPAIRTDFLGLIRRNAFKPKPG